jgi:3-isopropylmalate dehydrogenase
MLIALCPGDGVGPEVIAEAVRVLKAVSGDSLILEESPVGGAAYRAYGHPLPAATLDLARRADAILFGAVGDATLDSLERRLRPEQAILGLRREFGLFANLRPTRIFPELVEGSVLRPDIARGMDMLIVRESNGDVYFGDKGRRMTSTGRRQAYDLMSYDEDEIMRVARVGFEAAGARRNKLCSVGKANVLETSELWRDVVSEVSAGFPDVELKHMYADNAAMQLIRNPGQFDVIVTGNLFGDILSDEASMCAGSIGMQPSATLGAGSKGLYEPIHGSAPDIAGAGIANPLGAILSTSMMLRYSLGRPLDAVRIQDAVAKAIKSGARTRDIGGTMSTSQMGDAVLAAIRYGSLCIGSSGSNSDQVLAQELARSAAV